MTRKPNDKVSGGYLPDEETVMIRRGSNTGEVLILRLITPEAFLPSMIENASEASSPEKKLMLAILEDSVGRLQGELLYTSPKGFLIRDLMEWFFSEDRDWIFSFNSICEHLALDPDYIRDGLMRWMQENRGNVLPGRRRKTPRQKVSSHSRRKVITEKSRKRRRDVG
jgi:hypothetical protein